MLISHINPLYSRFIDELPLNEEQQKVINLSGIGKVRDLREAATLSLELNELLTRYSGFTTPGRPVSAIT